MNTLTATNGRLPFTLDGMIAAFKQAQSMLAKCTPAWREIILSPRTYDELRRKGDGSLPDPLMAVVVHVGDDALTRRGMAIMRSRESGRPVAFEGADGLIHIVKPEAAK